MKDINRSSSHAVFSIKLHIVFVTKYRRMTLTPALLEYLETSFSEILGEWRCKLLQFGGESDHIHMLVDIHPGVEYLGADQQPQDSERPSGQKSVCRTSGPFLQKALVLASGLLRGQRRWCNA